MFISRLYLENPVETPEDTRVTTSLYILNKLELLEKIYKSDINF